MKNAQTLVSHLLSQPLYAKLGEERCFRLLKEALPPTLRRGILFMYVKNRTLFFALKHPAFKMEFDYKLSTIKNLLTSIPPLKEACEGRQIEQVRAFVSRFAPPPKPSDDTVPRYRERAHPDFRVQAQDEEIARLFEEIRRTVEKNRR